MTDDVTHDWLEGLSRKVFALLADAENTFGDPSPGCYPSEIEMTLALAHRAIRRRINSANDPVPADMP